MMAAPLSLQTVLIDAIGFTGADARAGLCCMGSTGSGKTSGPGALWARAYLSAGFRGPGVSISVEN